MGEVVVRIDGQWRRVRRGTTVAAAMLNAGVTGFRHSVTGEARAPLCGMGICLECRAVVNGVEHTRTCQLMCEDGMEVRTA
jgi:sarcosine oxidase subunit alpha